MTRTSINEPSRTPLTPAQEAAWARRGFLVLKGWVTASDLAAAAEGLAPKSAADGGWDRLIGRLRAPVAALLADEPVLISLETGRAEEFGLDALDPSSVMARGVSAVIPLNPAWRRNWELRFVPESHSIEPDTANPEAATQMQRIAEALHRRGLEHHVLDAVPGDVWLRHPRLLRGALKLQSHEAEPGWLKARFVGAGAVCRRLGRVSDRNIAPQSIPPHGLIPLS
jgi:hypothetical protein